MVTKKSDLETKADIEHRLYMMRQKYSNLEVRYTFEFAAASLCFALFATGTAIYKFIYVDWIAWVIYFVLLVIAFGSLLRLNEARKSIKAVDEWYLKVRYELGKEGVK